MNENQPKGKNTPSPIIICPDSVPSSTVVGEPSVKPPHQVIQVPSLPLTLKVSEPTVWLSYPFAPEWFADALDEARAGMGHHVKRREILFAVCCAESYLVEWVRDEILQRRFLQLNDYFPPGETMGVAQKWKRVLKQLFNEGLIGGLPAFGRQWWEQFKELIEYRNGLIHASSSRPDTSDLEDQEKPFPSKSDLDKLESGWATSVVVALIREVHSAAGTTPPSWVVDP